MRLLFALDYLKLQNAKGRLIIRRDIIPWSILSILLSSPFLIVKNANYFHKDGFLDKIGSFSSVLLGFYVAALIAVATLNSSFSDLDKTIEVGVIKKPDIGNTKGEKLSRREYVCYMFGYMALISLFLSLLSSVIVGITPIISPLNLSGTAWGYDIAVDSQLFRIIGIVIFSVLLGSLAVTTLRGLYYLVERLYAVEADVDQTRDVNQEKQ